MGLLAALAVLSSSCSGDKDVAVDGATSTTGAVGATSTTGAVGATASTAQPAPPGPPGTNPLFPLEPGFQSVREGGVNKGNRRLSHRLVFTITDVRKDIGGVITVAALDQDFDGGELAEQSLDWFAIAANGDVSYLGSYTETYEGGQFVNATDAWLAGVKGGKGGILVPGSPKVGSKYTQADVPGEGKATGEVVKVGQNKCVKFKCFDGVVVIKEDGSELKYFAPGAGGIFTEPTSGSPQETEELINVTKLTSEGLAELSEEARRLDEHARTVAKDVYGSSAPAKRQ
ncbi:MAG: hypothetical protein WKF86_01030 [Acidimicrobiales bacterium]